MRPKVMTPDKTSWNATKILSNKNLKLQEDLINEFIK